MIRRIKSVEILPEYKLDILFDDGRRVIYDVEEDISQIPLYTELKTIRGLFSRIQLDESRTCLFWNDKIDLPSDTVYEYGKEIEASSSDYVAENIAEYGAI
ncbi:MAG: DUF2442 domain-containing protein [Mogibacterium sp.]|nr:DUF2442 domain-containing protein [Mogibacterium sp.]